MAQDATLVLGDGNVAVANVAGIGSSQQRQALLMWLCHGLGSPATGTKSLINT